MKIMSTLPGHLAWPLNLLGLAFSLVFILAAALLALQSAPPVAQAAPAFDFPVDNFFSISVDNADDSASGPGGVCTLRDAINAVNDSAAGNTIHAGGCFIFVDGTPVDEYVLWLPLNVNYVYTLAAANGELLTTNNRVIIFGGSLIPEIIQADVTPNTADFRVLHNNGAVVELIALTIRHGQCLASAAPCANSDVRGGGIYNESGSITLTGISVEANRALDGGGIYNQDTLSVNDSIIGGIASGNRAIRIGGGIYNNGVATVINSEVRGNTSPNGAGIHNHDAGDLTVDHSIISDNNSTSTLGGGGGILNYATMVVTNTSVISNNKAGEGGGIHSVSVDSLVYNSTIISNTATSPTTGGGGIYNRVLMTIQNTTVISNAATTSGGGIFNDGAGVGGRTTVIDSLILDNQALDGDGGGVYNSNDDSLATSVTGSCLVGNSDTAFVNTEATQQTATGNWWGIATGPNTPGGDTTAGNIDTSNFLTTPPAGCPEVTEPEILVSGDGNEITNGDTTPAAIDRTDFGNALLAGGTVNHIFTIANTGAPGLTLTGAPKVALSGDTADFTVATQPDSPADPSATFTIQFDPTVAGLRAATVSIDNNDADENPYTFTIQGTGTVNPEPEIEVSGNSQPIADGDTTPSTADHTSFGELTINNQSLTRTFTIINNGNAPLTLSGSPRVALSGNSAGFSVISQPGSPVASGGASTTFVIRFSPTTTGTQTATVTIANDDSNENPYNFNIQGTGQEAIIDTSEIYLPLIIK